MKEGRPRDQREESPVNVFRLFCGESLKIYARNGCSSVNILNMGEVRINRRSTTTLEIEMKECLFLSSESCQRKLHHGSA